MDLEALLDNATLIDRPPKNVILKTAYTVDEVGEESYAAVNVNMLIALYPFSLRRSRDVQR